MRSQIFYQNPIAKALMKGSFLSAGLLGLNYKESLKKSEWLTNMTSKFQQSFFGATKDGDCCGIIAYIGKKPLAR